MGAFNRKMLLSNIAALTKEKNVKMGDLETAAGVSAGYFSRLNKGESNAIPNIEVIAAVADKLEVTIDCLVKVDYEALTPSERYLIDFINKLLSETISFEKLWEGETVRKMLSDGYDEHGNVVHPLFAEADYSERPVYNSLFHQGEPIGLLGPAYHIPFDGGTVLWLAKVGLNEDENNPPEEGIEFYMQKKFKISPICHTVPNASSPFNEILFSLYKAAAESSKRPKIDGDVKSVIDLYMTDIPF